MKALWVAVGTVWFAGWAVCSYHVFASNRPVPVEVESESPLLPPPNTPAPTPALRRTFSPEVLFGGVPSRPTPSASPARPSGRPTAAPQTRRSQRPAPTVKLPSPPPTATGPPEEVRQEPLVSEPAEGAHCLLCREPAYSWVERDGRRYGYCLQHQGSAPVASSAATQAKGPRPQCLATTKAGTRCRRKAAEPGGYCYQHKPS